MNKHVKFLTKEDQMKWLQQRNWESDGLVWRDPETGIKHGFEAALKKAIDECRVPGDYELRPE